MVTIEVRYFARCRELAGRDVETLELPDGSTLRDVGERIGVNHPTLRPYLEIVRMALNQVFSPLDVPISQGDEVALIPPVSGGVSASSSVVLSEQEIAYDAAAHLVADREERGALATFTGIVRRESRGQQVAFLEYEGYRSMAMSKLEEIANEAREKWDILDVAVVHRLGRVDVGGVAVSIAVSARHRAPAFEACRYMIDRMKEDVPIWKKETAKDGATWWGGAG